MLDTLGKALGERGPGIVHAEPAALPQGKRMVVAPGKLPLVQQDRQEPVADHLVGGAILQGGNAQPIQRDREGQVELARAARASLKPKDLQEDAMRVASGHKALPAAQATAAGAAPFREGL